MDIFIDDDPLQDVAVENRELKEVVRDVQENRCEPGRIIVGVRCDGLDMASTELEDALTKPVAGFNRIDLVTGTQGQLVREAMHQAGTALDDAEKQREHIANLLTGGKTMEGIEALARSLDLWKQVHDAVDKSIQMLGMQAEDLMVDGRSVVDLLVQPKDVLVQVKEALEAQDYVMLSDLLQYEFGRVIEEWKKITIELARLAEIHETATRQG